jgi:hypothetical protein
MEETIMKITAVLSTTILPLDGLYAVVTLDEAPDLTGVPHYIGHPDTKAIVEQLGAVQSESKLFTGLEVGEIAIACAIKQGMSTRATEGHTTPHQSVTSDMLSFRMIMRHE